MHETITVRYVVNGNTCTDVLSGTDVSIQRVNEVLDVRFPNRDGKIINSNSTSIVGTENLRVITYAAALQAFSQVN